MKFSIIVKISIAYFKEEFKDRNDGNVIKLINSIQVYFLLNIYK